MKIFFKSWRQHPTRHQLYGHLPPITKTIQVRRARHAGHCWGSRDELIRDVLLWTPAHGRAKAGRPARTYIQLLCEDTGCCPEDLPRAMNDREEWRERARDIRATSAIWWWWIWNKKGHDIIISRVISSHMGSMYVETPCTCSHSKVKYCYWEKELRSRDVIHWVSASFWSMMHIAVLVIISLLKNGAVEVPVA